jgi:hypothetical protein
MDVCWACGTEADGSVAWEDEAESDAEAETAERGPLPPDLAFLTILFPPTFAYFLFTKLCHLFAPLVPDARHHAPPHAVGEAEAIGVPREAGQRKAPAVKEPGGSSEPELDALVLRAWRAALMGFFLLPPLLMTLYSTWLLVRYWFERGEANRRRDRLAFWTLGLNLLAAVSLGLLLAVLASSLFEPVWRDGDTIGPPKPRDLPYLGH